MNESDQTPRYGGPIAWMAQNSVTANLLMFVVVFGGLLGSGRVKQEVFPEFDLDAVVVMVPYPGASPTETEQGITLAIEEAVRGVEGVKRVTSTSQEGVSTSTVSLLLDADRDKALSDIKSAIDRIQSFPEDAEKPAVGLAFNRHEVISLVISGDQPLATLHGVAERARSELLQDPKITQVDIRGVPNLEIAVEVSRDRLESHGLTLDDIANAIRSSSLDLPGGGIETSSGEVLVRVSERKLTGEEFSDILLQSTVSGAELRLGDIATIRDGYADVDLESYFNGERAVRVVAFRVGDETPSEVAKAVKDYAKVLSSELPETLQVSTWNDDSKLLAGRIRLLVRNAVQGLALVLIVLAAFLNIRLAFWVALGIPISFLGAFLLMPGFDLTVNMISLFGFIVTLGMVVDDAIVVGENAFEKMRQGMPNREAAIEGAREMAVPVTFAILTTIAAFSPMFFVPGVSGKLFRILPLVVISVLIFSLVESFFILPAHLTHLGKPSSSTGLLGRAERFQEGISQGLTRFIEQRFRPVLHVVLHWRYVAFSVAMAAFVMAVGVVASGLLPFSFMPRMESNTVIVSARLPYGSRVERTQEVADVLEKSAFETIDALGGLGIYEGMLTSIGEGPAPRGPVSRGAESGSHVLTLTIQLLPGAERDFSSQEFAEIWSEKTPELPGVEAVTFSSSFGPSAGAAVDIQLIHRDTSVLAMASAELTTALRSYSALTDIENGYAAGKPQLDLQLRPMARTLGLSAHELARQVRASFYGTEALREQRGRNEFKVMVRLEQEQRQSEYDIEELLVRTPAGGWVPLAAVAEVTRSQAPTAIKREEGRRVVNVQGGLAPGVKSSREVLTSVQSEILPELMSRYPGLKASLAGQQREQNETFASLGQNYIFALFVIFALLAVPFKSYTQPVIVMAAIPFGFIGAVAGHLIMGYELSLISMFGIIALSGVVVNDSLVLIDSTNRFRRSGMGAREAVVAGACRRFRPIILTSLTTFFGLAPMILETEMQARFLIPMAVSLGFGVLFATVLILLLVPVLYLLREDAAGLLRWLRDSVVRAAA